MKILHVYGDEHSAMFVDDEFGVDKAYQLAKDNGGSYTINNEDGYAEVKIREFEDVDKKFIDFMKDNLCDYDQLKDEDFFIVED